MSEARPNRNRRATDKPQPRTPAKRPRTPAPMPPAWFDSRESALFTILCAAAGICNHLREAGAEVDAGLKVGSDGAFAPSVSVKAPGTR